MLHQIISGGQTGADRAALDTAIKFNIPHGGWIPKGRKTESGALPRIYQLKEMASQAYPDRTRQNILDSTGTVIISRGKLTGGSKLTASFARVAGKPGCHIDLFSNDTFEAAIILQSFILENQVRILNVAGPRASHDPEIYRDVKAILEAVLYLFFLESDPNRRFSLTYPDATPADPFPADLEQALALLEEDLDLRAKSWIARMSPSGIQDLYFSWLDPVKVRLGIDLGNTALVDNLKAESLNPVFTPEDGIMAVFKALALRLKKDYDLRVVP